MRYIIVDLEATCWDKGGSPDRMEIIEIGAVEMTSAGAEAGREFASFVRPVASPILSDFCKELTTIRQEDVDSAEPFWSVFPGFVKWIGDSDFTLCSWGAYDLNQFRKDCARHKFPLPESFEKHINLKREFSEQQGIKPTGMNGALKHLGLTLEGTHHRGIDDARNIAKIARVLLPKWEA